MVLAVGGFGFGFGFGFGGVCCRCCGRGVVEEGFGVGAQSAVDDEIVDFVVVRYDDFAAHKEEVVDADAGPVAAGFVVGFAA